MTLTEQWKKGELGNGEYFVLTNLGIEKIEYIKEHNGFGFDETEWVEEVLAPVPSYEEWKQLHKFLEEFNALDVAEENKKLKEMLYKCREKLDWLNGGYDVWGGELTDFIEEIDEVLK